MEEKLDETLNEYDAFDDFYNVQDWVKKNVTNNRWYKWNDNVPTRPYKITIEELIKLYCYILSRCHYMHKYGQEFSVYPSVLANKLNIELDKIKQGLDILDDDYLIIRVNKQVDYHGNHPLIIHTRHFNF